MNRYFNVNKAMIMIAIFGVLLLLLLRYRDIRYPYIDNDNVSVNEYESVHDSLEHYSKRYAVSYKELNTWIRNYSNYMRLKDVGEILETMEYNELPFDQKYFNIVADTLLKIELLEGKQTIKNKRESYGF